MIGLQCQSIETRWKWFSNSSASAFGPTPIHCFTNSRCCLPMTVLLICPFVSPRNLLLKLNLVVPARIANVAILRALKTNALAKRCQERMALPHVR